MSLALSARLATRELRGGFKEFRILIACLALGVAAIAAVGSIKQAIEAGLSAEGATLLVGMLRQDLPIALHRMRNVHGSLTLVNACLKLWIFDP